MTKTTIALVATSLFLFALASPVQAHSGNGGGFNGNDRLEGEDYSSPDSGCDPDFDGEDTRIYNDASRSGGQYAFLPHSGCGFNYGSVYFDAYTSFTSASFRVGGVSSTMTYELRVVVDGSVVASGSTTAAYTAGFVTVALSGSTTVAPGSHTVRVEYSVTSGPSYANLDLDYVDTFQVNDEDGGVCHLVLSDDLCDQVGDVCRDVFSDTLCANVD